jgi:hypothetical protein
MAVALATDGLALRRQLDAGIAAIGAALPRIRS